MASHSTLASQAAAGEMGTESETRASRRAESELARVSRLYSALTYLNQIVVTAQTREVLFEEVCRVLGEHAVVDDEDGVRTALQRAIARAGHESHLAIDGVAGLAQAAKLNPSVIILDLRMPKMDGHTFLRRLEALDLDAAVIVSSADGEMDDVIEVMRQGAVDYLREPWSPGEVGTAIDQMTKAVERDQALAAKVLQLGRSAHYATGKQIDLKGTITRLGLQSLHADVADTEHVDSRS